MAVNQTKSKAEKQSKQAKQAKQAKALTARARLFCAYYILCGNASEAAARAGYKNPLRDGAVLLMNKSVRQELDRQYEMKSELVRRQARAGYERLAFGSVADAVRLLFEAEPQELEQYDLFNVAEIKKPKEGSMEIKFFDRIRALEKLEACGAPEKQPASDFYSAIIGGIHDREQEAGSVSNEDSV